MKTEYRIIWPDGRDERHPIELPEHDQPNRMLRALDALIETEILGGAYKEHVRVFTDFDSGDHPRYLDMFVDEEGKLKGLPFNRAATLIYWENVMRHERRSVADMVAMRSDPIVGPAVLFRDVVWT